MIFLSLICVPLFWLLVGLLLPLDFVVWFAIWCLCGVDFLLARLLWFTLLFCFVFDESVFWILIAALYLGMVYVVGVVGRLSLLLLWVCWCVILSAILETWLVLFDCLGAYAWCYWHLMLLYLGLGLLGYSWFSASGFGSVLDCFVCVCLVFAYWLVLLFVSYC